MQAHTMKVYQTWMRPGGVMEFITVAKGTVPQKGFRSALLKDVLEASLATRYAVLQTITAIDEIISIPLFDDPSSPPPSPPGKFRILDHKAKAKVDQTKNDKRKKSR
ncbi:hypothetical protein BGZ46_000089 [Entomortierella lignicola]|nr:hypothetical protein BGZ46_000089 [Entomortierella lignicola]